MSFTIFAVHSAGMGIELRECGVKGLRNKKIFFSQMGLILKNKF